MRAGSTCLFGTTLRSQYDLVASTDLQKWNAFDAKDETDAALMLAEYYKQHKKYWKTGK